MKPVPLGVASQTSRVILQLLRCISSFSSESRERNIYAGFCFSCQPSASGSSSSSLSLSLSPTMQAATMVPPLAPHSPSPLHSAQHGGHPHSPPRPFLLAPHGRGDDGPPRVLRRCSGSPSLATTSPHGGGPRARRRRAVPTGAPQRGSPLMRHRLARRRVFFCTP